MSKSSQKRRRQRERQRERQRQLNVAGRSVDDLLRSQDFAGARDQLLARTSLTDDEKRTLARCHFQLGEDDKASTLIAAVPCVTAHDYYTAGLYYRYARRWMEAENALRASLSLDPDAPWSRLLLAESLLKDTWRLTVEHSEAQSLLLECCRPGQSIPAAFTILNRLMDWPKESEQILSLLQNGVELHPEDEGLRCCLVRRLVCIGDLATAEDSVAPSLVAPHPSPEALWLAFEIAYGLQQLEQALLWLERLLVYVDEKGIALPRTGLFQAKGDVLIRLGRLAEAAECFKAEQDSKSSISTVLPLAGLAHIAVLTSDKQTADVLLRDCISLWCEEVFNESCEAGYICWYDYPHRFETIDRLSDSLGAVTTASGLSRFLDQIAYLTDRLSGEPIPLKRLRKVARHLSHRIIDYDFSMTYGGQHRYAEAVEHHLRFAAASFRTDENTFGYWPTFYDDDVRRVSSQTATEIHRTFVTFLNQNERHRETTFVERVILPLYKDFWRKVLFDAQLWKEVKDVAAFLGHTVPNQSYTLFDLAYSQSQAGERKEAVAAYRELLRQEPQNSAAWHNLSLLAEDEDCVEAIECARKAYELAPTDEYAMRRWKQVQDLQQRKAAEEARRREEAARRDEFLQTARERFPQLDFHKRRILSTLTVIQSFDSLDHLAELSGTGSQYIAGNWRKLIELGMIVEDGDGTPQVNKYILDLVRLERSHAVATTLIRADDTIAFKPVFNSRLEYLIYNVMIGLFPNHLVFPNMSLQTIFQYERMKELVDADTFRYYLMSQVDMCVTSTSSYLPILAFEIDSHYHDGAMQQQRDERKNTIFRAGGVPLLRLRAYGQPNEAAIRNDIVQAVRELGDDLRDTHRKSEGMLKLELEIDFERFGTSYRRESPACSPDSAGEKLTAEEPRNGRVASQGM